MLQLPKQFDVPDTLKGVHRLSHDLPQVVCEVGTRQAPALDGVGHDATGVDRNDLTHAVPTLENDPGRERRCVEGLQRLRDDTQ